MEYLEQRDWICDILNCRCNGDNPTCETEPDLQIPQDLRVQFDMDTDDEPDASMDSDQGFAEVIF